jgi:hypothetical protein
MPAYYETGHAKNVANFQDLNCFLHRLWCNLQSNKKRTKTTTTKYAIYKWQNALADVVTKNTAYNNAVNARIASFDGFVHYVHA